MSYLEKLPTRLANEIQALSFQEKDALYSYLRMQYVEEDIRAHLEDVDLLEPLDDGQIRQAAMLYVEGDYDCNIPYWQNIEAVINKVRVQRFKETKSKIRV